MNYLLTQDDGKVIPLNFERNAIGKFNIQAGDEKLSLKLYDPSALNATKNRIKIGNKVYAFGKTAEAVEITAYSKSNISTGYVWKYFNDGEFHDCTPVMDFGVTRKIYIQEWNMYIVFGSNRTNSNYKYYLGWSNDGIHWQKRSFIGTLKNWVYSKKDDKLYILFHDQTANGGAYIDNYYVEGIAKDELATWVAPSKPFKVWDEYNGNCNLFYNVKDEYLFIVGEGSSYSRWYKIENKTITELPRTMKEGIPYNDFFIRIENLNTILKSYDCLTWQNWLIAPINNYHTLYITGVDDIFVFTQSRYEIDVETVYIYVDDIPYEFCQLDDEGKLSGLNGVTDCMWYSPVDQSMHWIVNPAYTSHKFIANTWAHIKIEKAKLKNGMVNLDYWTVVESTKWDYIVNYKKFISINRT